MKVKIALVFLLFSITLIGLLGCDYEEVRKTTGGGWFNDYDTGAKVTFGFSAIPTVPDPEDPTGNTWDLAKGKIQLIDHSTKTKVHGTFEWAYHKATDQATEFWGLCSINGMDGFYFFVDFWDEGEVGPDKGDAIGFYIYGGPESYYWQGELGGGNIKIHRR